jgi:ankyrin repeat protein
MYNLSLSSKSISPLSSSLRSIPFADERAVFVGCTNLTTFLISKGANVNDIESWGSTALHYAAMEGDVDSTRLTTSSA